jgi:hypothetical protein
MSPFDWQLSKVVHDERLQGMANFRHFDKNGNWSERTLHSFGNALISLARKLRPQSQSEHATSASQLS